MTTTTLDTIWTRPALMIFSADKPVENDSSLGKWNLGASFLYLTDDSRSELQVSLERIEYKKRMINGRMRSYHVADKKTFSVNWKDLPSQKKEISESKFGAGTNWASCQQMLEWHKSFQESFYLTLVYDTAAASADPLQYRLEFYNVFFDDFSYSIKKRGTLTDLWDISMALVEV